MPTGIYQSLNRKGGQKGRSGVYIKSQEHRNKIRDTLKRKKIKPSIILSGENHLRYWLGKNRSEKTKQKISLAQVGKVISLETRKKMGFKKEKHWH